ncbi:hypothetical protein BGW42_000680 [Actinomortierella wolfii]|nr:hypothetical protein BGW42_000680 [Actinomortierella wolfii]
MYARRLHRWTKKIQTEEEIEYDFESIYPDRLSLYLEPPLLEISMDEFEQCAFDRMQILTTLQNSQMRGLTPQQLDETMAEAFEKYMPMTKTSPDEPVSHELLVNERLKDHISHYILRLAYCRSPELRAWFLKAECALFKYRFDKESLEDQIAFLEHQSLFWRRLSDADKRILHKKLLQCYIGAKYYDELPDEALGDNDIEEGKENMENVGAKDMNDVDADVETDLENTKESSSVEAAAVSDTDSYLKNEQAQNGGGPVDTKDRSKSEDEEESSTGEGRNKNQSQRRSRNADTDESESETDMKKDLYDDTDSDEDSLVDFKGEEDEDKDGESKVNINDVIYFEVDFERVPGLVGRRDVYVKGGKAYVPMADQVTMVLDMFRDRLSDSLEACALALPGMDEDDRLVPVLDNINDQYLGKDYTTASIAGELQADDVNGLIFHMPPCMEQLHTELRKAQHLRHGGRMQYGLFLKGIGLPLEQALIFWQKAFGKHTAEQFNKEYAYNIRHSYGMEGKRTDYTPYSCKGIIMNTAPGAGDHHGCPFRHWPAPKLRESLAARGMDEFDQEDVMQFVQGKHYQLACTRFFEVTRAQKMGIPTETLRGGLVEDGESRIASQETIEHPNQFFEQSYLLFHKPPKKQANNTMDDMDVDEKPAKAPLVRGGYTYKKATQSADTVPTHQRQSESNTAGAIDVDEDDDDDV